MPLELFRHVEQLIKDPFSMEKKKRERTLLHESQSGELILLSTLAAETIEKAEYLQAISKRLLHVRASESYGHSWSVDSSGQNLTQTHILENYRDENSVLRTESGQGSERINSFSDFYVGADQLTEGLKIETDGRECFVLIFPDLPLNINRKKFAKLLEAKGFRVTDDQITNLSLFHPEVLDRSFRFCVSEGRELVEYYFTYLPVRYDTDHRELSYFICTRSKLKTKVPVRAHQDRASDLRVLIPQAFRGMRASEMSS